uniref:Uncharacterized protein n=1 Tax=Anguilla anguilla TaxID=7936 RepID=A0A0E9SU72_ANGAN
MSFTSYEAPRRPRGRDEHSNRDLRQPSDCNFHRDSDCFQRCRSIN